LLRGALKPRVEVAPPYAYSVGDAACELMIRAGMPLDEWQADAVRLLLAYRSDGLYACFEYAEWVPRQNGKGGILEARVLAGFLLLGEPLIMWSAHEYKTAMRAFRRLKALLIGLGRSVTDTLIEIPDGNGGVIPVKVNNTHGEEGFERLDQPEGKRQEIKFVARSKSSGRGFSGDLVIIDETFAYTLEQQDALMPTMGARQNPQIIYTSTPPLRGDTAEPMYSLRERAEAILRASITEGEEAAMELAAEEGLGYRDWGHGPDVSRLDLTDPAVSPWFDLDQLDAIDLDDREIWAATNPALGVRKRVERIAKFRRAMSSLGFGREELGIWPRRIGGKGGSINPLKWNALADPDSKRVGGVVLGVDIATERGHAALSVYGLRGDELGHLQLVDYRPGTLWLADRIAEWKATLGDDLLAVAMGRGTYASLKTDLEQRGITVPDTPDEPGRGDIVVIAGPDMAAACGHILDDVRNGVIRHVPEPALTAAATGAKAVVRGDSVAWSTRDLDVEKSPVVSASVARRGYAMRAHLIKDDDYDALANIW
jgi:hypothetical protein